MNLLKTKIQGPALIKTNIFNDNRGFLKETFRNSLFGDMKFPFDLMSYSNNEISSKINYSILW